MAQQRAKLRRWPLARPAAHAPLATVTPSAEPTLGAGHPSLRCRAAPQHAHPAHISADVQLSAWESDNARIGNALCLPCSPHPSHGPLPTGAELAAGASRRAMISRHHPLPPPPMLGPSATTPPDCASASPVPAPLLAPPEPRHPSIPRRRRSRILRLRPSPVAAAASRWDRLPREIQDMVLDHAGAFTKLINGLMLRIEAESLPQAERERMWQEAIMCNWQGDLRLLPWVHIRSTCLATPCTREMLGRLHACKAVDDAYVLQTAARERWPELLQSKYADELAAAAAREDAVWLLEDLICARKAVRPSAWLAGIAAQHGNLDAVRFLHSLTPAETWCKTVLDGAAASGNLDLVVWLATNRREGFSHAAMAAAAQNGHLHVVQWLHDNRDDGCSPFAMSWAAQGGHVHVLEWFTLHASPVTTGSALADEFDGHEFVRYRRSNIEACSPLTISAVARNGHVAVLEFLRARFPRCFVELPQDAFNEVADVLVLTWLHAHGLIVEPESLLERLVDRGDAACIRWLCTTFSLRITQSLFDKACGRNELRLARWMLEAGCVRLTEQRVAAAVASRNVGLLAVFFAHSNTLLALAYRQAVDCGVADVVEWMEFRYSRGVAQLALSFDV